MEYFTADTYKGWVRLGKPYDKNGKLYTKVKSICNKCNGKGIAISHVENGVPIPYVPDAGICYSCQGVGSFNKEVRLYTEAEYNKMTEINEKNRQRREAELEQKMKDNYAKKKSEWLLNEGFSSTGETFIITGDSYSIKEELKSKGWRYNKVLRWHKAEAGDYAERCIKVNVTEVADFSAWGSATYKSSAMKLIEDKINAVTTVKETKFYGEVKDKIKDLEVTVSGIRSFDGMYGRTMIYTFEKDDAVFTWFTTSYKDIEVGDTVKLSGIIKGHEEYKNVFQTVLTRCSIS